MLVIGRGFLACARATRAQRLRLGRGADWKETPKGIVANSWGFSGKSRRKDRERLRGEFCFLSEKCGGSEGPERRREN